MSPIPFSWDVFCAVKKKRAESFVRDRHLDADRVTGTESQNVIQADKVRLRLQTGMTEQRE